MQPFRVFPPLLAELELLGVLALLPADCEPGAPELVSVPGAPVPEPCPGPPLPLPPPIPVLPPAPPPPAWAAAASDSNNVTVIINMKLVILLRIDTPPGFVTQRCRMHSEPERKERHLAQLVLGGSAGGRAIRGRRLARRALRPVPAGWNSPGFVREPWPQRGFCGDAA